MSDDVTERSGGRFGKGNPFRFKPGTSGNPGGAPGELALARREAVDVLRSLLKGPDVGSQLAAAMALLACPPAKITRLVESLTAALRGENQ